MLRDRGADGGGRGDGGILLLDEPLGQAHQRGVVVGRVGLDNLLRLLLRVGDVLAIAELLEVVGGGRGFTGGSILPDVQADERLL